MSAYEQLGYDPVADLRTGGRPGTSTGADLEEGVAFTLLLDSEVILV